MNKNERTLNIDGLVNARDLGGLVRKNGMITPFNIFYRAENIDQLLSSGWEQIKEAGIRTIVDLRQQGERDKDTQIRPDWITTIHSDLDGLDNDIFWKDYWDQGLASTAIYYLPHLEAMPERAGDALSKIATAPDGGVLFHCKSGRDRTGLIALLLLSAIDTDPEEIVDDYLETVRLGEERGKNTGRENPEPALEEQCRKFNTTTEGAFRSVVEELEFSKFLNEAGLSSKALESLRTWRGSIK